MAKKKQLETVEAEVSTQEVTTVTEPATPINIHDTNQLKYMITELQKFIREQKLSMQIQGKDYVNIEGWEYLGTRLGVMPTVTSCVRVNTGDDEMKYEAWVVLRNITTGMEIGSGFAICSNKESGKRYYQEFAIASMSQTRAIGKAYRNTFAWIVKAAGYSPTPAEEMDYLIQDEEPRRNPKAAKPLRDDDPVPMTQAVGNPDPVPMASVKQKTELLLLLNNKHITQDEKAKMIESINTLDSDRIQKSIIKVQKVIDERKAAGEQV